jgi:putative restriction endonuclease
LGEFEGFNMSTARQAWTRDEVLAALHLYTQLSFGQLHQRNPEIKALADRMGRTPSSVAMKLTNLASLDPQITASGRKGLPGASQLDRAVWDELQSHWDSIALQAASSYEQMMGLVTTPLDESDEELPEFAEGRTSLRVIRARTNQQWFRKAVLNSYQSRCCISGLTEERLLIASHIVPWSEDTENRLNPQNGLCLSALHDKAFDLGLITVTPEYRVLVSPKLKAKSADAFMAESLLRFDGETIELPERFRPKAAFLAWHGQRFGYGP